MTKADLINISENLIKNFQPSVLSEEMAALLGTDRFCFFDAPLIGIAAADDQLFEKMKDAQIIGGHFITPKQWLENAKTVISIFVPYSAAVRKANSTCPKNEIAPEYVYGKNYLVPYIDALEEKIVSAIKEKGYSAVIPSKEGGRMKEAVMTADGTRLKYTSGWSERHAAYACGLGTFGISGGLITAKIMNWLSGGKINPLIGSAGVSAVPMAARVSQTVGQKEDPSNFLLMHAMGPNVAGVIGSAVAAGVFLSRF